MTLMAGYDVVVDLSASALRKVLQSAVTVRGGPGRPDQPLVPWAELERTTPDGDLDLVVHVIVAEAPTVALEREADDTPVLSVTIPFVDSSIAGTVDGTALEARALAGEVVVTGPVETVRDDNVVVRFDLGAGETEVRFDDGSERRIEDAIDGMPVPPDRIRDAVDAAVADGFQDTASLASYPLVSGCGSLDPPRFTGLEVHPITGAGGDVESLGFFGYVLPDAGGGDPADRTEGSVVPPGEDYSIAISPEAFRRVLFCPALPEALDREDPAPASVPCTPEDLPELPGPCGEADAMELEDRRGRITRLEDQLGDGFLAVEGDFEDDGFCYEATGDFRNEITVSAAEDRPGITSSVSDTDVSMDVDVDWWCRVGIFLIFDAFELIGTFVAEAIAEDASSDAIAENLGGMLGGGLGDPVTGPLGEATIESVDVSPEGLRVDGLLGDPPADRVRTVTVECESEDETVEEEDRTVEARDPCLGITSGEPRTSYPVTFVSNRRTFECRATGTAVGRPFQWTLSGLRTDDSASLEGEEGTVTLTVDKEYPEPFSEPDPVRGEVDIEYRRRGNVLELQNDPADGDYTVRLTVTGTETDPGTGPSARRRLDMEGKETHSTEYQTRAEECMAAAGRAPGPREDEDDEDERRPTPRISSKWTVFEELAYAERERLFRETVLSDQPGIGPFMAGMGPVLESPVDQPLEEPPQGGDPDERP